jgi:perosamine synthetase
MTNLQAALLVAQLERLTELLEKRYVVIQTYIDMLSGRDDIKVIAPGNITDMSPWIVSLRSKSEIIDPLMANLKLLGIDSRPFFAAHSRSNRFQRVQTLPISESASNECFNLPTYPDLKRESIEHICTSVLDYFNRVS